MACELLVQVTAPHFCAGLVLVDDVATEAAPILRWCIGRSRDALRRTFVTKGWKAIIVPRA